MYFFSEMCTGNFMELDIKNAKNGKQRPPPGTKCVGGCIQKSGRWGETSCYTEADESQWGAECMACIGLAIINKLNKNSSLIL